MKTWIETDTGLAEPAVVETSEFELYVRGEIPACLAGSLVVATSRRHKDRSLFTRWHDSQADLLKLDLFPGRPGRVRATFLAVDPNWPEGESLVAPFYATQPNHGLNCSTNTLWATNLLFGSPLEIDLASWKPRRILQFVKPEDGHPQITTTSHFAWSIDNRYAYFHQSLLERESVGHPVRSRDLMLVELDVLSGCHRTWEILPPPDDVCLDGANFHSAFYFEENGGRFVGLLHTGAVLETLAPHDHPSDHTVFPMQPSTIWVVRIPEENVRVLHASLLPGIREIGGFALSHLDVDNADSEGFTLFANYKQTDVAEETHGENVYGEQPEEVPEHYSGMIVEAFNCGYVIRYSRQRESTSLRTFCRPYVPGKTSLGHSWLPINVQLDSSRQRLFCSFSGFRPRLLPRHVARAYEGLVPDLSQIRYVPPLLMRFDSTRLEPDTDPKRRHLSYAESVAFTVVGSGGLDYICTFAPDVGLRIYDADDLSRTVGYALAAELMTYRDTHFRPMPAHMQFVPR
jgi:hypothetical protein